MMIFLPFVDVLQMLTEFQPRIKRRKLLPRAKLNENRVFPSNEPYAEMWISLQTGNVNAGGAFVSRIFEEKRKEKHFFFAFAYSEISIFDNILALFTIIVMAVINNQRQRGFAGFSLEQQQ